MSILLLVVIGALVIWGLSRLVRVQQQVRLLSQRLDELGRVFEDIKDRGPGPEDLAAQLQDLAGRIQSLESSLGLGEADLRAEEGPPRPEMLREEEVPSISPLEGEAAAAQAEEALEPEGRVGGPWGEAVPAEPPPPPMEPPWQPEAVTPEGVGPPEDWERFMGVKLFAWLGGFALFLGAAFFVKYSIDHELISPWVRVALGYLLGVGLVVAGLALARRGYGVTVQTLCAAGIAILYADVFACRALYHFFGAEVAFLFMSLVTAAAFLLAVRLNSQYVAVLGLIGGFLTPPLLSTGEDRPIALFSYVAILDLGLVAVALKARWGFLIPMTAAATWLMEVGWTNRFFHTEKALLASAIYLFFCVFFLAAQQWAERREIEDPRFHVPAGVMTLAAMGFVGYMLTSPALGSKPGLVLTLLLLLSLVLACLALSRQDLRWVHLIGGAAAFCLFLWWTLAFLTPQLLGWALSYYLGFAVLHTGFPIVLQRVRPSGQAFQWGYLFAPLTLILIIVSALSLEAVSLMIWPFVLLINGLIMLGAWILAASWLAVAAVALTMTLFGIWIFVLPEVQGLRAMLLLLAVFTLGFFSWGLVVARRARPVQGEGGWTGPWQLSLPGESTLPAFSAFMPFALLAMAALRLPLRDPSEIFALVGLLVLLLLALGRRTGPDLLAAITLFAVVAVESVWHFGHFSPNEPLVPILWYVIFYGVFALFPFLRKGRTEGTWAWVAAALVGPMQFILVYHAVKTAMGKAYIGVLPALFAIASLLALYRLVKTIAGDDPRRMTILAWSGGVALFFISLIFPLQFEKEWITLGWALEGLALIWLYRRVPHPGLKGWGVCLLGIAFVRLAFNPAVLTYHVRAPWPVLNWFLYAYGVVAVCLFVAGRLLAPPRNRWMKLDIPPVMKGLGTALLFLLLNIEIADYFSTGWTITFQFSGDLARDMTYSLGWALFGMAMLIVGILTRSRGARLGSLVLLSITMGKVFLHDLWSLGQLYRVASMVGLAVTLILASFLYQRFLTKQRKGGADGD